ncbi:nitroreductase family protein [Chloroflexota bacterium]
MDAMEAILTRRSIRKYTNQPVSDEVLKELLEAAMYAPSASNCQPWHFVVIKNRDILNEIPGFHPYSQMLKDAPLAILVCCDQGLQMGGYGVQDCSAATQNILLAAHAKGLGAVWLGLYPTERTVNPIKKLLNLPEQIIPVSLISIGYPAKQKPRPDRYRADRIHHDHW